MLGISKSGLETGRQTMMWQCRSGLERVQSTFGGWLLGVMAHSSINVIGTLII
jgi:hypothetical protein